MSERQPYSRVYWTFLHDDKAKKARRLIEERHKPKDWPREVAAFRGTWLMLLIQHDQAFPAPGILPASLHQPSVDLLVEVEFVRLIGGDAYELSGLQAERSRRADAARREPKRDPEAPQPGPKRDPVGSQDEPSLDENKTSPDAPTRAPDPADVYWTLTGRYPTDKVLGWLDQLSSEYGELEVIKAVSTAHVQDRNAATLLGRTTDVLRSEARALSLKAQEAQRQRLKERRAAPREIIDPAALEAEIQKILRGEAA